MSIFNTSYEHEYVIQEKTDSKVILRLKSGTSLYATYWKKFIALTGAEVTEDPPEDPLLLLVEQVPPAIIRIGVHTPYNVDYPIVSLRCKGRIVNITKYVTVNKPNSDTPGLYALDFRLDFPETEGQDLSIVVWTSFISIEEEPVLRKAASTWNRENYTIQTLNRLVMEPQFIEALYEAGSPLYNFMMANETQCLRPFQLESFKNLEAYYIPRGSKGDVFITGAELPTNTTITTPVTVGATIEDEIVGIGLPHRPREYTSQGFVADLNLVTIRYTPGSYLRSQVVTYGGKTWYAVRDTSAVPGTSSDWIEGHLYPLECRDELYPLMIEGPLPLLEIWAYLDLHGYIFSVDLCHNNISVSHYWGEYSPKYYADYRPGDLVFYHKENTLYLMRRTIHDITEDGTIRDPVDYRNPNWEEIYSVVPGTGTEHITYIKPHANATNAVVSKTCSSSRDICALYAQILHIPQTIQDYIGAKASALLYVLIAHTRNTYEGLQILLRSIGLDIKNFRLEIPSTAEYLNGSSTATEDFHEVAASLRAIAANISNLQTVDTTDPVDGAIAYTKGKMGDGNPSAIVRYDGASGKWKTLHDFGRIDPTKRNNMYYTGDASYLSRVASDAVDILEDGAEWLDVSMFADLSAFLCDVIRYEIPIYIWFLYKVRVLEKDYLEYWGYDLNQVFLGHFGGCNRVLIIHPYTIWDPITGETIKLYGTVKRVIFHGDPQYVMPTVSHYFGTLLPNGDKVIDMSKWEDDEGYGDNKFNGAHFTIEPEMSTSYNKKLINDVKFDGYWQSQHDLGSLGLKDAATLEEMTIAGLKSGEFILVNGKVEITLMYSYKEAHLKSVTIPMWNYIVDQTENNWEVDTTTPYLSYHEMAATLTMTARMSPETLKESTHQVTLDGSPVYYVWDGTTLYVPYGTMSIHEGSMIKLMTDSDTVICSIALGASDLPYDYAVSGAEYTPRIKVVFDY